MSIFSSISDSLKIPETDSVGDDNAGLSAAQNNPLLSSAVLGMRTAYDSIHMGFSYIIKGKKASLKQIDKYIDNWINILNSIVTKYQDMLKKIDDLGADATGVLTLDFAKEAWEMIQDTPILRRYMGEANYWYLYDTLGLLSTQSAGISADLLAGLKEAIKQAILAVIASTDGLISLQSYMGYLQSAWGFLYIKCFSNPTLDSILPQVTTAYWYKPTHSSYSSGKQHRLELNNNPPGNGFVPVPLPVPDPKMLVRNRSYREKFSYTDPDTWYLEDTPYYMPNTMDMLHRALEYWGSSYTNAMHVPNVIYPRRDYDVEGYSGHPLTVGKTLYQLDTNKMSVGGSSIHNKSASPSSIRGILDEAFTSELLQCIENWQRNYETAYSILIRWVFEKINEDKGKYGADYVQPTTITDFMNQYEHANDYKEWYSSNKNQARNFRSQISMMHNKWESMLEAYAEDHDIPLDSVSHEMIFDTIMNALVNAAHASFGYPGSIDSNVTLAVGPSTYPKSEGTLEDLSTDALGVPFIAYRVDTSKGILYSIDADNGVEKKETSSGDTVTAWYPTESVDFVMFPSSDIDSETVQKACIRTKKVAGSIFATVTNVPIGLKVRDSLDSGTLLEYVFDGFDMEDYDQGSLGALPEALCLHRSCGFGMPLDRPADEITSSTDSQSLSYLGTYFFPDGKLPMSLEDAKPFDTYYTRYLSYLGEMEKSVNDELADVVGYAINNGREPKYPCFGVYGNIIKMASWNYKEMPYSDFTSQYRQVSSGSKLYYKVSNPSSIILYHSSYMSQIRQTLIAVYHESVAQETKSYGPNDTYTYYVFPSESISVFKLPKSGVGGYNLGALLSTDALDASGNGYHYTVIKNPTPICPKYVNAEDWSFMDIVYELTLLAHNLSGLCGDNGMRMKQLEDDLKEFGLSIPEFLGELPENNGQFVDFKFGMLEDYAKRIEDAIDSVYELRSKLIAATMAW